ncbi:hypothetical protein V6N12_034471 [Hibiscus sabdariffa]|uniref:Retrotransposon gag domain-containing protein n=1 Tax=Hibiscus sabdariffa TaxID=183260 RepID=A0ABR2DIC5_9ROSI
MTDGSYHSNEARESHASLMDDTRDEFVPTTNEFDIPMGPEDFYGTREDDPIVVGQWLRDTLKILWLFHFTPECNLECIISLLQGDAYDRWETVEMDLHPEKPSWDQFLSESQGRYIGQTCMDDLRSSSHNWSRETDQYPPEVFSELVQQAKFVERVLSMRSNSIGVSSIQSKKASDTASPSQTTSKKIHDFKGFWRASSPQSQRSGYGLRRPRAYRRPLTSSSLASSRGSTYHFIKVRLGASGVSPAQT